MDKGLTNYEKMWGGSVLYHSIKMPQEFRVGSFLKAISRRQKRSVDLLGNLCRYFSSDWACLDESSISTNTQLADIEAQVMFHFPKWKEHLHADVEHIKVEEMSVKTIQQVLLELNNWFNKQNDKLGMIFNSFSDFQSSLQKPIQTVT